jgi:hypothetical protein
VSGIGIVVSDQDVIDGLIRYLEPPINEDCTCTKLSPLEYTDEEIHAHKHRVACRYYQKWNRSIELAKLVLEAAQREPLL